MQNLFQNGNLIFVWLYISALFMARYIIIAGIAYLWLWKWKVADFEKWRIQKSFPENRHLWRDFYYSVSAMAIFATVGLFVVLAMRAGLTRIYFSLDEYSISALGSSSGWIYFIFSIILILLFHDAFFYWAHRFMHLRGVYQRVHLIHHLSTNPSPWTAFAFHPFESVLEALVLPLAVIVIPLHLYAIIAFLIIMTIMNVIGHLGFEMYPSGFVSHPLGKWNNTSTHHNMHHNFVNANYGLYFNWWDSWMKTNHPDYIRTFEKIKKNTA